MSKESYMEVATIAAGSYDISIREYVIDFMHLRYQIFLLFAQLFIPCQLLIYIRDRISVEDL